MVKSLYKATFVVSLELPQLPGTYALILELDCELEVEVGGRRGRLKPGTYVYIGSALGAGGLKARVSRHCSKGKGVRWHIDQLTRRVTPSYVVYAVSNLRLECRLVRLLLEMGFYSPIRGFGSTDCRSGCPSHLLASSSGISYCIRAVAEALLRLGVEPKVYRISTRHTPLSPFSNALASRSLPTIEP
ncbi:MAG TPA: GIY-YIG nuclease family protein [Thermofilaceae archaeon]|nr:GIY-YIG nuclease family protein [Thermofilaceae archaeon]